MMENVNGIILTPDHMLSVNANFVYKFHDVTFGCIIYMFIFINILSYHHFFYFHIFTYNIL